MLIMATRGQQNIGAREHEGSPTDLGVHHPNPDQKILFTDSPSQTGEKKSPTLGGGKKQVCFTERTRVL